MPAPRRRALAALRLEEREEISRGIAVGRSIRQIAQGLGRAPSTVSREIRRNVMSFAIADFILLVDGRAKISRRNRTWRLTPRLLLSAGAANLVSADQMTSKEWPQFGQRQR